MGDETTPFDKSRGLDRGKTQPEKGGIDALAKPQFYGVVMLDI